MSTRKTGPTVTCYCDRCDESAPTTATTEAEAIRQVTDDPFNRGRRWIVSGDELLCDECAEMGA